MRKLFLTLGITAAVVFSGLTISSAEAGRHHRKRNNCHTGHSTNYHPSYTTPQVSYGSQGGYYNSGSNVYRGGYGSGSAGGYNSYYGGYGNAYGNGYRSGYGGYPGGYYGSGLGGVIGAGYRPGYGGYGNTVGRGALGIGTGIGAGLGGFY